LSFGGNLNDFLGEYPQKIDLNHLKNRLKGESHPAKKFKFFRENLTGVAINLSRCASKRILKIDYLLGG